jgi:Bifunctional DNA primase/polymerase, N-terminal
LSRADELLAAAIWYAGRRVPVFPCEVGGKRPAPVALHGFKSAASDADRIRAWWHKPFNIGSPTGYPGDDVLDVDVRPSGSGWPAFNRLKAAGMLAGAHKLTRTRSGGLHVHFSGTQQGCGRLKAEHLDFKSTGGYILLPPSYVDAEHTDDGVAGSYEVIDERPPTGAVLDWEACRQLLSPPRPVPVRGSFQRGPGSARHLVRWLEGELQGNRNSGLFWACCRALEARDEDVVGDLADVALSAGLGEDEVRKTIGSAYRKAADDGW